MYVVLQMVAIYVDSKGGLTKRQPRDGCLHPFEFQVNLLRLFLGVGLLSQDIINV